MLAQPTRIALAVAALAVSGCSTARTTDVLEARLRSQEDMLAHYESEVTRVKTELSLARRETEDLRVQLADAGQPMVPAEESGAAFRATGIAFSSLMTGGADLDGEAGHDGLTVVLTPHDHDGELVKLPGNIEIEAFDLSLPGGAQRIGHWTFDQREVHEYWHKGVIQSGYQFELPWQTPPKSDQVLVHGYLSTANGRRFDTTLTVKVDVPTGGIQQAAAEEFNPFAEQQVAAERVADDRDGDIIWANGEGPAHETNRHANPPDVPLDSGITSSSGQERSPGPSPFGHDPLPDSRRPSRGLPMAGFEFAEGSARSELLRSGPSPPQPQRLPRPRPLAEGPAHAGRNVPPPIEDWWSDDDWATQSGAVSEAGVRTSDAFTDETIPRYR